LEVEMMEFRAGIMECGVQPSRVHTSIFRIFPLFYNPSICHHNLASFPASHFTSQPVAVLTPNHLDRPSIIQSHPFHLSNQKEHIKFHHKTPIANEPVTQDSPFPNHIPPHFSAPVLSNRVYLPTRGPLMSLRQVLQVL
jgi:hypothetical protein